jgi:hypothetical protein
MLNSRLKQSQTVQDRPEEATERSPGTERSAILQDRRHDWAKPGRLPPTEALDFVEWCFVAMTAAGFIGIATVLICMGLS